MTKTEPPTARRIAFMRSHRYSGRACPVRMVLNGAPKVTSRTQVMDPPRERHTDTVNPQRLERSPTGLNRIGLCESGHL
jgi:hypothetical protein